MKKQIERYREMTGEQRLALALELHEMSCDVSREGIRRQHPEQMPLRLNGDFVTGSRWRVEDERTRTFGGLLAAFDRNIT